MGGEDRRRECSRETGLTGVERLPSSTLPCSARRLTSVWCLIAKEFEEPLQKGKQMKKFPRNFYAPSRSKQNWIIPGIDWGTVELKVKMLQMRIAKAAKARNMRKVRSLQWLLAHSFYAKLLAVKRVTTNKGRRTCGVDGVLWNSARRKLRAVRLLKRRGYHPLPLRRVYIKKKSGKLRPLGSPTMRDRAMQASS